MAYWYDETQILERHIILLSHISLYYYSILFNGAHTITTEGPVHDIVHVCREVNVTLWNVYPNICERVHVHAIADLSTVPHKSLQ